MKTLIILALLVSAQLVHGQTAHSQTSIEMKPFFPIVCAEGDAPLVNQVDSITRVSETADQVTFKFKTSIGACVAGDFRYLGIMTPDAVVETLRNRIILFHKDPPVVSQIKVLSPALATVQMTFDKKSAFKKRDVSTYTFLFLPRGFVRPVLHTDGFGRSYWTKPGEIQFAWNVILTKISATETSMKVAL